MLCSSSKSRGYKVYERDNAPNGTHGHETGGADTWHGARKKKITHPQRVSAICVVAHTGQLLESQVRQVLVIRGLCGVVLVCVCVSIAGVARLLDRGIRLIISCSGWVLTTLSCPLFEPYVVSCFVDLFQVLKRESKSSSLKIRATNCTTTRESHDGVSTCPGHVVQGQHVAHYRVQQTHRTVVQDQRFRRPVLEVCQREEKGRACSLAAAKKRIVPRERSGRGEHCRPNRRTLEDEVQEQPHATTLRAIGCKRFRRPLPSPNAGT